MLTLIRRLTSSEVSSSQPSKVRPADKARARVGLETLEGKVLLSTLGVQVVNTGMHRVPVIRGLVAEASSARKRPVLVGKEPVLATPAAGVRVKVPVAVGSASPVAAQPPINTPAARGGMAVSAVSRPTISQSLLLRSKHPVMSVGATATVSALPPVVVKSKLPVMSAGATATVSSLPPVVVKSKVPVMSAGATATVSSLLPAVAKSKLPGVSADSVSVQMNAGSKVGLLMKA
jgi:hypothetical protein